MQIKSQKKKQFVQVCKLNIMNCLEETLNNPFTKRIFIKLNKLEIIIHEFGFVKKKLDKIQKNGHSKNRAIKI